MVKAAQTGRVSTTADRLAMRHRPEGQPIMHQNWGKLLFLHWRVDPNLIQQFIPKSLTLDLYGDSAWLGITPFTMWDIRALPPYAPSIPGLDSMHELNVRTYVHYNGAPGVWFFSLDVNSEIAATAARTVLNLPYYASTIEFEERKGQFDFRMKRPEPPTSLAVAWTIGKDLPQIDPASREFFLTERYCLYTESEGTLYRARIHHEPWPLQHASLKHFETNIFEASRLPVPQGQPLVHYAAEVDVDIWMLEEVEETD